MARGTLMASATRLVISVPAIMAAAPYCPVTGFQVRWVKNSTPMRDRAGQDSRPSWYTLRTNTKTITAASSKMTHSNIRSLRLDNRAGVDGLWTGSIMVS